LAQAVSAPHALRGRDAIWCVPTSQNLAGREGLPGPALTLRWAENFGVCRKPIWSCQFGRSYTLKMLTPTLMYIKRYAKLRCS